MRSSYVAILMLLLGLVLQGCGQSASSISTPHEGAPALRTTSLAPSAAVSGVSVELKTGWNPVGLQAPQVSVLNSNPNIVGQATFGPAGYTAGAFDTSSLNAGAGGRRGFMVYASAPTSFTYSGGDDGQGDFVDLSLVGYNLVSFCTATDLPASRLTAVQNGQTVPLSSVVLTTFFELGPNGQTSPVEVPGGILRPGRPYWVFAREAGVRLRVASPSPSPSVLPGLVSLELTPGSARLGLFSSLQFTLLARFGDGSTRDVTSLAEWSSVDPSVTALLAPGLFKGLNPFTTTIRAVIGGQTAETSVEVITLNQPGPLPSPSPLVLPYHNFPLYVFELNGNDYQRFNADGTLGTQVTLTGFTSTTGLFCIDKSATNFYIPMTAPSSQVLRVAIGANTGTSYGPTLVAGSNPMACAFDPSGRLFVTEAFNGATGTGKVQIISADGSSVTDIVTGLSAPRGIAIDPSTGNFYVAELNNHRLLAYQPDGTPLASFGGGSVITPDTGDRCIGVALDSQKNVFLGARSTSNVYKITPSGTPTLIATLGTTNIGLAFDTQDNIWLGSSTLTKLDASNNYAGPGTQFSMGFVAGGVLFVTPP